MTLNVDTGPGSRSEIELYKNGEIVAEGDATMKYQEQIYLIYRETVEADSYYRVLFIPGSDEVL